MPIDQRMNSSMVKALDNEVSSSIQEPLLSGYQTRIAYFGGTIPKEDLMRFKKLIFRATRGKAFT